LQLSSSVEDIRQISSKLTFVDLAGSENLKKTGAQGQRQTEGIQINKSLSELNQVINSLADNQKLKHGITNSFINYRNSNLTHLLKDALGGSSQTLFLACVSPSEDNESETLSTLNVSIFKRCIFLLDWS
jgi:kinesin family protein 4/21/27